MLAMDYRGPYGVRAASKPEPTIKQPSDAIVRVTCSCICGSDLHLYHGLVLNTRIGATFGHEFTGVVEDEGDALMQQRRAGRFAEEFERYMGFNAGSA